MPQPDHARDTDDHRNDVLPSTISIRLIGGRHPGGQKHAYRDEKITQHFCVRGQHIGQEDVAKFAILGLGDAPNTDAFERGEKPVSSGTGNSMKGYDEENDEKENVGLREDIPSQNQ